MKLESIIPEIKKIIIDSNKTNDIDKLIGYNLRMAGYSFYLGEYVNDCYRTSLDCYNLRKEFEANYIVTGEGGVSRLQAESIVKSKEYRLNEVDSEVMYNRLKGYQNNIDQFIQANTQKIAHLRKEFENSKK
jgi:hypothetical protein